MSGWHEKTFKPLGAVPDDPNAGLRRLAGGLRRDEAQHRREDARDLRRRLRHVARQADTTEKLVKGIIGDLRADGHDRAVEAAAVALLRLKQAEAELESARDRVSDA